MAAAGIAVACHGRADRRAPGHGADTRVPAARDTDRPVALLQEPRTLRRLHVVAVVSEPGSAASRRLVEGRLHADEPHSGRTARRDDDQRTFAAALLPGARAAAWLAGAADTRRTRVWPPDRRGFGRSACRGVR